MTAIAAWLEDSVPILIGDFVVGLTGDHNVVHTQLPTREDLDAILPDEWQRHIVDLRQKVYCIADNLAIGWAGSELAARQIIRNLKQSPADLVSIESLQRFFERQTDLGNLDVCIIGWLTAQGDAPTAFRWQSRDQLFEQGTRFIHGTGGPYVDEQLKTIEPWGEIDSPVARAIGRVGGIVGHEVMVGSNLENLFGGGLQIIAWQDGRFRTPSVSYMFAKAAALGCGFRKF
jgi:hypothetical protein